MEVVARDRFLIALLGCRLTGIATLQTFIYFQKYPEDRRVLRNMVRFEYTSNLKAFMSHVFSQVRAIWYASDCVSLIHQRSNTATVSSRHYTLPFAFYWSTSLPSPVLETRISSL